MKKIILGILCCVFPTLLTAQPLKPLFQAAVKSGAKASGQGTMEGAKITRAIYQKIPADIQAGLRPDYWKIPTVITAKLGSIKPSPINVSTAKYDEGMVLYRTLNFKTPKALRDELIAHGEEESERIAELYRKNLEAFLALKKEFDIFLGYQKLEPKPSPFYEQTILVKRIEDAQASLAGLRRVLGSTDPVVQAAELWLRNVYAAISPMAGSLMGPAQESLLEKTFHEGRVFNADEFLLKNPDGTPLRSPFATPTPEDMGKALQQAQELPARTIAFLNDDPEILEWARDWAAKGYFGKGTRVAPFDSMERLVEYATGGAKYDLIFLDYVLEDGLSMYVVDEIRASGNMDTVIILNSALEPHEVPSEELFKHGVDGFVTSVGSRPDTGWVGITNALHNYQVYKDRNGWTR